MLVLLAQSCLKMGKSSALKRKQSKTKGFSVGDEVEVQSEDEGFRGAWYEATVVRPLPRHRRHSVVYTSLLEDAVSCRPLHEYVLDSHLRPRHPRRPGPPFQIHQVVDAFHQDGWWPGVVADVRGGRYAVYFPSTREEEEFVESDVRAHLRWVKGQWISDSEDSVCVSPFALLCFALLLILFYFFDVFFSFQSVVG